MCECKICELNERAKSFECTPEMREFLDSVLDNLFHSQFDRDYYKSIVEGTWPDADELIFRIRARDFSRPIIVDPIPAAEVGGDNARWVLMEKSLPKGTKLYASPVQVAQTKKGKAK